MLSSEISKAGFFPGARFFVKSRVYYSVILALFMFSFSSILPVSLRADQPGALNLNLMPYPARVNLTGGEFRLTEKFYVGGHVKPDHRVFKAACRFMSRLAARTGLFFEQDYLAGQPVNDQTVFLYHFERPGQLVPGEDESYLLEINPEKIELKAKTDLGLLHGLETLLQVLSADSAGYYFPCLQIEDSPRFTWRGLLIDSSRHFMPVEVIKRNLLAMSAVKLNVLHWHLSDDQGFRVESKSFPRLHQLGSDGLYYRQAEIIDIIQLASDLGIRVVPEFDLPGHSTSWLVAYPEYGSLPGPYQLERKFGVSSPVFNPAEEKTYKFFDRFLKEMTFLFPDPYFHLGGDEVEPKHWKENPEIQKFMKKNKISDEAGLQAYFNRRLLQLLTKYHKKMIGWDEIYQPGLPKNIVIQSWRGQQALVDGAKKGYQGILSNGYYIDLVESAERHYLNDPLPSDSLLTPEEKKLILGGEATMWAELVTPETVDSRLWPRSAAIAERFWSPKEIRDVDDMYKRLRIISLSLEENGINHLKNQPMMLRRLAQSYEIGGLEVLARVAEPVKGYARHSQGKTYNSLAPLTRFVDACFPESLEARDFRQKVEKFIGNRDLRQAEEIKGCFRLWQENHQKIVRLANFSPILKETVPLSASLLTLSQIGVEAVDLLMKGKPAEPSWLEEKFKQLEEARKSVAECQLAIWPGVKALLDCLKK
ncbi:MAG: family 20 glycosylhydrolase [Acidobacteriota bacterium]|nr:family 20 glycosylhydrolase [Acidobacteriota bacterium]